MKSDRPAIVVLDSATLSFDDIDLNKIFSFGSVKLYRMTSVHQTAARIRDAEIVITNKVVLSEEVLRQARKLRLICVAATGYNNIDTKAAAGLGMSVCNVAGYSTDSVVQWTLFFILAMAGNACSYVRETKSKWPKSKMFVWPGFPVTEISGKTLGIIGYGSIGRKVAGAAKALGMKILIAKIPGRKYASERVKRCTFTHLLKESDFISLHAPLSKFTDRLFDSWALSLMNPSGFLINMGRGQLVDPSAVAAALKGGKIAGYATDVLEVEPAPSGHPLLKAPNVLMTPHIAWASLEARQRLTDEIARNIRMFLKGKPRNLIV